MTKRLVFYYVPHFLVRVYDADTNIVTIICLTFYPNSSGVSAIFGVMRNFRDKRLE